MMYYVVTEGRARKLDRLNLRDRSTYGLDWMVFEASSARDVLHQWGLFKAGTHPRQKELELEVTQYQLRPPGYAPRWEAQTEAIASRAEATLGVVEARQRELEAEREVLNETHATLSRAARLGTTGKPRRRRATRARRRPRTATGSNRRKNAA